MTNYQQYQLEHYGNILPEPELMPSGQTEAAEEEIRRSAEWVQLQSERQLWELEREF